MSCKFPKQNGKLFFVLYLTFLFFLGELTVSRLTSSLTTLLDSFHTLSSVITHSGTLLAASLVAETRIIKRNTFGWARVEVIGSLISSVFLTGLCITVILEAMKRFMYPRVLEQTALLIVAGTVGLFIRLLGLLLFWDQRYSPPDTFSRLERRQKCKESKGQGADKGTWAQEYQGLLWERATLFSLQLNGFSWMEEGLEESGHPGELGSKRLLYFQGIFFHILKDAFGSVIVVVNSVTFYLLWNPCTESGRCHSPCIERHCKNFVHWTAPMLNLTQAIQEEGPCWLLYLDPSLCFLMALIWLYTTSSQLKESAHILLQAVPKKVDLVQLRSHLLCLEGVLAVHELHIWQLARGHLVGTVHVKCQDYSSYMELARRIKVFFCSHGINTTTIQPEFTTFNCGARTPLCDLACEMQCMLKQCCSADKKRTVSQPVLESKSLKVFTGLEPKGKQKDALSKINRKDFIIMEHETTVKRKYVLSKTV